MIKLVERLLAKNLRKTVAQRTERQSILIQLHLNVIRVSTCVNTC